MTDITKPAQSLKAAAEKWQEAWVKYDKVEITIAEFIRAANQYESIVKEPANILALVEALEKAQQRITEMESRTVTVKLPPTIWYEHDDYAQEIAVLEKSCVLQALTAAGIKWEAE